MKTENHFLLVWIIALLCSACADKNQQAQLTKEDSLKIALEIVEDSVAEQELRNMQYQGTSKMETDPHCQYGKNIPWNVGKVKVKRFLDEFYEGSGPIFLEFEYTCFEDFIRDIKIRGKGKPDLIRAYFSADTINNKSYRSILFVPAYETDEEDYFTEQRDLVFDVGSPCPPGCNRGIINLGDTSTPDDDQGVLMALDVYNPKREFLPCLIDPNVPCQ